jgi:hypothetical protein
LLGWRRDGKVQNMLTLTPLAMMAATSLCQTSTESQESLPGPAIVGEVVGMDVACWVMWIDVEFVVGRCESDQVGSGVRQSASKFKGEGKRRDKSKIWVRDVEAVQRS